MPLRRKPLLLSLLALLAAAAGLWRLSRPEPIAVVLKAVERGRVESTVANTRAGTVRPCRRSRLSPGTGGQVAAMPVREGQRVQQGDLLLGIWNQDLDARVQLAGREQAAADARAEQACLLADKAGREAQRVTQLRTQRLVSEEQADRAESDAAAAAAACRAARAAAEVSSAQVALAQAERERTVLRAPFAGVVAEVNGELGEFITPSPPGIPTPPAVDLIDDSCLYVSAPIDEVDAPAIRVGMPACVSLDAFPGRRCGATVRRIAPYVLDVEKQSRTVEVEVDLARAEDTRDFLPGYSADVEIVLETRDNTLRVPTEAVLQDERVLVYRPAEGSLEERRFEPGLGNWQHTEVRSGLREGEQVVVSVERAGVKSGARVVPEETGTR
jgi:HlyD family secretion protein